MANPVVIDLSHWNPEPDWEALYANGTVGVVHKITEGTSYVDDTCYPRAAAAMDAGLLWSTYHFLRPGDMRAQMRHYLDHVNPVAGERLCLDHEDASVSLSDLRTAVQTIYELRPDVHVTIYSGHVIKEQLDSVRDEYLSANTDLWIAHYTGAEQPTWPSGTWPRWTMWQYTDQADAEGCDAPVDGDRFNGTLEELQQWFGVREQPVPVPPEPPVEDQVMTITASSGVLILNITVDVQLIVNGVIIEHD